LEVFRINNILFEGQLIPGWHYSSSVTTWAANQAIFDEAVPDEASFPHFGHRKLAFPCAWGKLKTVLGFIDLVQ